MILIIWWLVACAAWLLGIKLLQERAERIWWIVIGLAILLPSAWFLIAASPS